MKMTVLALLVAALTLTPLVAGAQGYSSSDGTTTDGTDWSGKKPDDGYRAGIALTIGEGFYFLDGEAYRGPVSVEVVPSVGWAWFKLDLGISTRLESLQIADTRAGDWNVAFRPGVRLTPPVTPLYARMAMPLEFLAEEFNWGVMFGVGADIPIMGPLGLVIEVDTTLNDQLAWGGDGLPLEFRGGISFKF